MAGKRARGSNNSGKEMSPSSAKVISPASDVPIFKLELEVEGSVPSGATGSYSPTSAPPDKAGLKECSADGQTPSAGDSEGGSWKWELYIEEEEEELEKGILIVELSVELE